jgi:hypothetical protein
VADRFVFADESGNFDFSLNPGASKYFLVTTVSMGDCRGGDALAQLRRELTWKGLDASRPFHACEDKPAVRSAVFELLKTLPLRIDATALEKRKAEPHLHNELALYKMGWYLLGSKVASNMDIFKTGTTFFY